MYKINRSICVHTTIFNSCAYLQLQTFPAACFPWKCWMFGWVQNMSLSAQIYTPVFASFGEDSRVSTVRSVKFDTCTILLCKAGFLGTFTPIMFPPCSLCNQYLCLELKNPQGKENLELNFSINCLCIFLNTQSAVETYPNFPRLNLQLLVEAQNR